MNFDRQAQDEQTVAKLKKFVERNVFETPAGNDSIKTINEGSTTARTSLSSRNMLSFVGTPVQVASSPSSSTTSSPNVHDDVWDSPTTPRRRLGVETSLGPLTPCTPISAYKGAAKPVLCTPSPLDLGAIRLEKPDPSDEREEYFQPKKLFRIRTKDMEAITNANATAVAEKQRYSREPSFEFSNDKQPDRSRGKSPNNQTKVHNVRCAIKIEAGAVELGPEIEKYAKLHKDVSYSDFQDALEGILPMDFRERMKGKPHGCAASYAKNRNQRCTNQNADSRNKTDASETMSEVRRVLNKISTCFRASHFLILVDLIEQLVSRVLCGSHRNVALSQRKSGARIELLRSIVSIRPEKLESTELRNWVDKFLFFKNWVEMITETTSPLNIQHIIDQAPRSTVEYRIQNPPRAEQNTRKKPEASSKPVKSEPTQVYLSDYQPHQLKRTQGLSVPDALLQEITRPLTNTEVNFRGYVYMFWKQGKFGMIKIGRTNNLERRLKEWNRKVCGQNNSYHASDLAVEIPHIVRIERLVHTELKESRLKHLCECGTTHDEWFFTKEALAEKVLQKWQDWILQEPYALNPDSQQWEVRPEMQSSLEDVCQPIKADEMAVRQRRRSDGVKGKGKKKLPRRTI